jgi:hypothetical protein
LIFCGHQFLNYWDELKEIRRSVAVVIAVRGLKKSLAKPLNITAFAWHFHDKRAWLSQNRITSDVLSKCENSFHCVIILILHLQTFCSFLEFICYIEPNSWRVANGDFKSMWKLSKRSLLKLLS